VKNWTGLLIRGVIGLVFIVSAYTKFMSPGIVEIILVDHGIAHSRESAAIIVRLLTGIELGIGILFFQPYSLKRIVIPVAFLFLAGFTCYLIFTGYILKDMQNCGCFGEMIKMSPAESIFKNLFLMALLIILFKTIKERKRNLLIPALILIIAAGVVFAASRTGTPGGFKFYRYTNFTGEGRVDLLSGTKIVAVFNLECDHCRAAAADLAEMKIRYPDLPPVYELLFAEGETTPEKFDKLTGSNFPYTAIGAREFFDFIGNAPPRFYLLENGKVKEIWDGDFKKHIIELAKRGS